MAPSARLPFVCAAVVALSALRTASAQAVKTLSYVSKTSGCS
jgi:hypothetical protein